MTNVYRDSARYVIIPLGVTIALGGIVYYTISRDVFALGFTMMGLIWVNLASGTRVSVDDESVSVKTPLSRLRSTPISAIVSIESASLSWNFNRVVRFRLHGTRKLDLPPGMAFIGFPNTIARSPATWRTDAESRESPSTSHPRSDTSSQLNSALKSS